MNQIISELRTQAKFRIPKKLVRLYWVRVQNKVSPFDCTHELHQCIFIHIPKTGGTSVTTALFNKKSGHYRSEEFEIFDSRKFNNYFKFAFVRNPWDRFLSAYLYLNKGGDNSFDKAWSDSNLSEFNSFAEFTNSLTDEKQAANILSWMHFTPQYLYVCNHKSNIVVDFIGRFENLNEDYERIRNKLGISSELPHLRKTKSNRYQDYYTEESRKIVANLYQKDIEIFNYSFE